jgi:cytochrome c oxidase cbb3-type subunit 4
MDINLIREAATVLSFLIFAGILYWAWDSLNDQKFHDASLVPLEDDGLEPEEWS